MYFNRKTFSFKICKRRKSYSFLVYPLCVVEEATPIHTYKEAQVVILQLNSIINNECSLIAGHWHIDPIRSKKQLHAFKLVQISCIIFAANCILLDVTGYIIISNVPKLLSTNTTCILNGSIVFNVKNIQ